MTKRCIPCLSDEVKIAIRQGVKDPEVLAMLEEIAVCQVGPQIQMCGVTGKRPRSAYQQFISECMKSKNIKGFGAAAPAMKECALEWRTKKE